MRALARGEENKRNTECKFVSDYSLLFDTVVVNYLSVVNSFDN